uniref:Uncharacterized protein n=1 Tax=Marseillevirus LCMAC101 TaxID=2506602 RepID=A0A481YSN4_9VIRU|nr:MAG: hypothetical protein LCMAC101_00810 [Marseillevirus LCMAC101]
MRFDLTKTLNGINWRQFFISNILILSFIAVAIYLKNNHHPAMAGMVAVMPIAFISFYFAKKKNLDTFAFSMGLGLASYSMAAFAFYYFIHYQHLSRMQAILWSMLLWMLLIIIFYYVFTDGPYSANGH